MSDTSFGLHPSSVYDVRYARDLNAPVPIPKATGQKKRGLNAGVKLG